MTDSNSLITASYSFSNTKAVLMTHQPALAIVSQAILITLASFIHNLRCTFWVMGATFGLFGAVTVPYLDVATQRDNSLAGVYLMGFYSVP